MGYKLDIGVTVFSNFMTKIQFLEILGARLQDLLNAKAIKLNAVIFLLGRQPTFACQ